MRYGSAAAFRNALEQRLRTCAAETGLPLVRLRKEVVFERFLARLVHTMPEHWVLKGGVALDFRLRERARTTKDLDLATALTEAEITAAFVSAQEVDFGDYFNFSIERLPPHPTDDIIRSIPYRLTGEVAGRIFESAALDVGLGDPLTGHDAIGAPNLLDFADIPPVQVPVLPLAQHIAEKVHAYTRVYAGGNSSRVKDLIDLDLIARYESVESGRLRDALQATFARRNTHPLPKRLPSPPYNWQVPYARAASDLDLDHDLSSGIALAAEMLDPILAGNISPGRHWNPVVRAWTPST